MKIRILIVGLIGLLLAVGLILAGCDSRICPDGGSCILYFTGQGLDRPVIVQSGTRRCNDGECSTWKMTGASAGYSSTMSCGSCGK